ncbi:Translation machinery-associated protein 22 [Rhizina undulata]
MTDNAEETAPVEPQAKVVIYCGVCSLPPEYCEFGTSPQKCKEWLESTHPSLVAKVYDTSAVAAAMSNLSVEAKAKAEKAEQTMQKRAQKEEARAEREHAKKMSSKVILKRVERTKRKHVIIITGLEAFDLDLKKVAKDIGKRFACGSSVTKGTGGGPDEIVVQGDMSDEIMEYILEKYPNVPEDNIDQIEEKKKKKEGAA